MDWPNIVYLAIVSLAALALLADAGVRFAGLFRQAPPDVAAILKAYQEGEGRKVDAMAAKLFKNAKALEEAAK